MLIRRTSGISVLEGLVAISVLSLGALAFPAFISASKEYLKKSNEATALASIRGNLIHLLSQDDAWQTTMVSAQADFPCFYNAGAPTYPPFACPSCAYSEPGCGPFSIRDADGTALVSTTTGFNLDGTPCAANCEIMATPTWKCATACEPATNLGGAKNYTLVDVNVTFSLASKTANPARYNFKLRRQAPMYAGTGADPLALLNAGQRVTTTMFVTIGSLKQGHEYLITYDSGTLAFHTTGLDAITMLWRSEDAFNGIIGARIVSLWGALFTVDTRGNMFDGFAVRVGIMK